MRNAPNGRGPAPEWTRPITARLTPAIKALILVDALVFVTYVLVREMRAPLEAHLALGPGFLHGEIWQPLTAIVVHVGEQAGLRFVFNLIGLWFVGALVERTTGTPRFLAIFFVPALLGGVTAVMVNAAGGGGVPVTDAGSLAVLALFVAFGRLFDRTQAHLFGGLFLQARTIAIIMVVWAFGADLMRHDVGQAAGDVVLAAAAFALSSYGGLRAAWDHLRGQRARRRFGIIEGGRGRNEAGRGEDKRPRYLN